jgi:hypothetical protein
MPIFQEYLVQFQTETIPIWDLSPISMRFWTPSRTTARRKLSDVKRVSERFPLSIATQPAPPFLRVLLIGSQEEDFFLIREILVRNLGALPAELDHAGSIEEAKATLGNTAYGLVLFCP